MTVRTVAILSPGDMGHGVGQALRGLGFEVTTCLEGRSDFTKMRAERAGFRALPDLDAVVSGADLILSILPPESALDQARTVAEAMTRTGKTPPYVDCNAVSPDTARDVGAVITAVGASFVDAGILGLPPAPDRVATRFYASGPGADVMSALHGNGIDIRLCGDKIGDASAIKMCYAAVSKGTNALHTATMMMAEALGVGDTVRAEYAETRSAMFAGMEKTIPRLAADSGRWVGEMEEIAATFKSCGITPNFHLAAAEIFRVMAASPFAAENRETVDPNRTMEQTVREFLQHLPRQEAAE